jgi:hypothetical protein
MSDPFGTRHAIAPGSAASADTVHEAYSFACMNCGHGWEQSYEIAHHTDEHGHTSVVYYADSRRVPSPLTQPTCANCGGHLVRIMRSGRVSGARWDHLAYASPPPATGARRRGTLSTAAALLTAGGERADAAERAERRARAERVRRGRRLAELLAFLHVKHRPDGPAV